MRFKNTEKKIIIALIILWIVSKPFMYLKYTNITIGIVSVVIILHYCFSVMYERRNKVFYKISRSVVSVIIILSTIVFIVTQAFIYVTPYRDAKLLDESEIDYVVVLGAGLRGKELSYALKFRLDRLLELKLDDDTVIVVSGGQGPDELITEARAMSDYLIENGIDEDLIILEEESTNTFENFKFSLEKLKSEGFVVDDKTKFAVVTNDFHIFRAKYILSKLGYESIGVPAKTPYFVKLDYFFREFFAVIHTVGFDF